MTDKEKKDLWELARRAYLGTSFSPEKRANSTVSEYIGELDRDLRELQEQGGCGNYKEKYLNHLRSWLGSKSRCMSSMIAGPANFPVARNRKYMDYEHSAYEKFRAWRSRYFTAVYRVPTPSPEEELDNALSAYEKCFENQELMKSANKILRSKTKNNDEKKAELLESGWKEKNIDKLLEPDVHGVIGVPAYALTNNNAKLKRLLNKVATMKRRIKTKKEFEQIKFEGGYIDIQDDRVVIFHNQKPSREAIDKIKARGFRWSPKKICWCRKHTTNALYDAKMVVGKPIGGLNEEM